MTVSVRPSVISSLTLSTVLLPMRRDEAAVPPRQGPLPPLPPWTEDENQAERIERELGPALDRLRSILPYIVLLLLKLIADHVLGQELSPRCDSNSLTLQELPLCLPVPQ
jgi:hypothetical protein